MSEAQALEPGSSDDDAGQLQLGDTYAGVTRKGERVQGVLVGVGKQNSRLRLDDGVERNVGNNSLELVQGAPRRATLPPPAKPDEVTVEMVEQLLARQDAATNRVPPQRHPDEYKWTGVKPVGCGGQGAVFEATKHPANIRMAIKVVPLERACAPSRYGKETSLLQSLGHPNIVRYLDAWEDSELRVGVLAMEFVEGLSLFDVLRKTGVRAAGERDESREGEGGEDVASGQQDEEGEGKDVHNDDGGTTHFVGLSPVLVVEIGGQLCEAVAAMHGKNIAHSDIKPHNMMLHEGHTLKLVDLGAAHMLEGSKALMVTSAMHPTPRGTAAYSSPAVLSDPAHRPDKADDVWSICATLYHLACGLPPFPAATPDQLRVRIGEAKHDASRRPNPERWMAVSPLTKGLCEVLNKGLNVAANLKEHGGRYDTVEELQAALRGVLREKASEGFDVFLSHRQAADKDLAHDVFRALDTQLSALYSERSIVDTYLDLALIKHGDEWKANFLAALCVSRVVALIVSTLCLRTMETLGGEGCGGEAGGRNQEKRDDNVLLEWLVALMAREHFLSQTDQESEGEEGEGAARAESFKGVQCVVPVFVDSEVFATASRLVRQEIPCDHLARKAQQMVEAAGMKVEAGFVEGLGTVGSVVERVMALQGVKLFEGRIEGVSLAVYCASHLRVLAEFTNLHRREAVVRPSREWCVWKLKKLYSEATNTDIALSLGVHERCVALVERKAALEERRGELQDVQLRNGALKCKLERSLQAAIAEEREAADARHATVQAARDGADRLSAVVEEAKAARQRVVDKHNQLVGEIVALFSEHQESDISAIRSAYDQVEAHVAHRLAQTLAQHPSASALSELGTASATHRDKVRSLAHAHGELDRYNDVMAELEEVLNEIDLVMKRIEGLECSEQDVGFVEEVILEGKVEACSFVATEPSAREDGGERVCQEEGKWAQAASALKQEIAELQETERAGAQARVAAHQEINALAFEHLTKGIRELKHEEVARAKNGGEPQEVSKLKKSIRELKKKNLKLEEVMQDVLRKRHEEDEARRHLEKQLYELRDENELLHEQLQMLKTMMRDERVKYSKIMRLLQLQAQGVELPDYVLQRITGAAKKSEESGHGPRSGGDGDRQGGGEREAGAAEAEEDRPLGKSARAAKVAWNFLSGDV